MKMLKTILKQFFHEPVTTLFPEEPPRNYAGTRGHLVFDPSKCTSCTMCMKRCPSQAIIVDRAAKTWIIDRFRCVMCGNCVDVCKFDSLSMEREYSKSAAAAERGVEKFDITYVKPEKPKKEGGE
ncbi:MAG: 4Fe-4S binding protein [Methanocorpusculum sp.]|jgi:ech hydrogenase subunit F|nr:4Fe-4S binding protein [Methanocorpusculum sp.]